MLAWTFLLAALGLFASLTFVMHESGAVQLDLARGNERELRSGHLVDFYLWHFLDAVPPLRVTESLRWEQLVTYQGAGVGWLLLAFKLFVIIPVIGIFRSYWQYRKQRTEARPQPEGSPSAAVLNAFEAQAVRSSSRGPSQHRPTGCETPLSLAGPKLSASRLFRHLARRPHA